MLLILRRFLAEGIKRRREELGLNQEEVARRAGVPAIYVSHLEQGSRNVNLNALDEIAQVLGCKPSILFAEAELKAYHAAGEHSDAQEIGAPRKTKMANKFKSPSTKYS